MVSARRINLKHLRYFHEVAKRGSVTAAARALHVAPQTVSAQLRELESSIGHALLERSGRGLVLTATGQVARDYAATIFALGDELTAALGAGAHPGRLRLRVGVTDSVAKLQTIAVFEPIMRRNVARLELTCREGTFAHLLGEASAGQLDAVLADSPVPPSLASAMQSRVLMHSGTTFLGRGSLLQRRKKPFPSCLNGLPLLATSSASSSTADAVSAWLARNDIEMQVAGHFDDSALAKSFAQRGLGIIAVPSSIETEVVGQYDLAVFGRAPEVTHTLYLIRPRRHRPHALIAELERHYAKK